MEPLKNFLTVLAAILFIQWGNAPISNAGKIFAKDSVETGKFIDVIQNEEGYIHFSMCVKSSSSSKPDCTPLISDDIGVTAAELGILGKTERWNTAGVTYAQMFSMLFVGMSAFIISSMVSTVATGTPAAGVNVLKTTATALGVTALGNGVLVAVTYTYNPFRRWNVAKHVYSGKMADPNETFNFPVLTIDEVATRIAMSLTELTYRYPIYDPGMYHSHSHDLRRHRMR